MHDIRRNEMIPAQVYGYGIENKNIQIDEKQFADVFRVAGYTSLINLSVENDGEDSKPHTVIVRELQLHPVKNVVLHIDFYQPRLDQTIVANVPLTFVGEAPAVKDLGGVLVRAMDEVEVEALPADLPHDIEVDISQLSDFEKSIHVRDLVVADDVDLHHEPEDTVALVQPPRTEEEIEALTEEVSEDIEGVEGVEEKEEPEEGEESGEEQENSSEENKKGS